MKFAIMICALLFGWFANASKEFKAKKYDQPVREISIIATEDGFYPNKIVAFEGEKLHFFVTSTVEKGQCFILQNHEVFLAADKGKVNETEVIAENPGRFKFYCPANKSYGHLTVIEKNNNKEVFDKGRAPASTGPSYWLPRDHD
ncbi:MAG: hypothetical protein CME62_17440 [Halobacteriovoraceae bacterium]|nr:hypothetical protein [Halobacteriovoraceae bacterium]|tara:strand:+ start:6183 stop:6617 length:435 start_codon:yes stop_codon:yes gene_type:complete